MKNVLFKAVSAAVVCLLTVGLVACHRTDSKNTVSASDVPMTCYRSLLTSFDYGEETTYVIGHKTPDADTVGSAVAYAGLLNRLGIKAQAAVSGELNKETSYAYAQLGIESPAIVDNAEGKQFVLVDHSSYSQAIDGMNGAKVVGILDHHGIGDVNVSELINVRCAPVGATASLVYLAYRECGVEIPEDMAKYMLVSIISDTHNMKRSVTVLDQTAYDELREIAGVEDTEALYTGMAEAEMSYEGLSDKEIFLSDYKDYEIGGKTFGMASLDAYGEEKTRDLAERMVKVMEENYAEMGLDMLFAKVSNAKEDSDENMMYMVAYGEGASELLLKSFDCTQDGDLFIFKENLSRKKQIIPAMTTVLESKD